MDDREFLQRLSSLRYQNTVIKSIKEELQSGKSLAQIDTALLNQAKEYLAQTNLNATEQSQNKPAEFDPLTNSPEVTGAVTAVNQGGVQHGNPLGRPLFEDKPGVNNNYLEQSEAAKDQAKEAQTQSSIPKPGATPQLKPPGNTS